MGRGAHCDVEGELEEDRELGTGRIERRCSSVREVEDEGEEPDAGASRSNEWPQATNRTTTKLQDLLVGLRAEGGHGYAKATTTTAAIWRGERKVSGGDWG